MEAAIRTFDSLMQLEQWLRLRRKLLPLSGVIDMVSERLRTEDGEIRYDLARCLASLLSEAQRYRESLQVLDEVMDGYPDDVRSPIQKATLWLYFLEDPVEALRCIDVALERARRTGFFRREALGVKARILLMLGRGEPLSDVLEEIMSLRITKDIPDVGRERDFVDRAPPGLIRKDILARYNEFRPKRPGDSDADEPPEYERPELE